MNHVSGTTAMGHDTTMAPSNGYGSDTWTSLSPYSQSPYSNSPLNEYNNFGGFVSHTLPSESIGRMPPPPQMMQPAPPMAHHQLPMLNTTWPSQLTNPSPSTSGGFSAPHSAPPLLSMPPVTSAAPKEVPRLPLQHEKSRKTLTTEQKRAMCQFHEDNPGTRQADIGARFGVERSTVSKVLRQRDQYLKREEPDLAALKRAKQKHPDFDRTLSNYVIKQKQRGFEVSDDEILEQAKLFAHASGNQEAILTNLTSSWLQKFKQKHGIGANKLMRRASEPNIPGRTGMSKLVIKTEKSSQDFSPSSPTTQLSPLSGSRSDEEPHFDGLGFDFGYKHADGQHSTTSLASDIRTDTNHSSFSSTMSPTAPFSFSPDPNMGGGFPMDQLQGREKRSNTFPSLNMDYVNQPITTEPSTPRNQLSSTTSSSALDSPALDLSMPFPLETNLNSPPRSLRRTSSNSSMTARSATNSATASGISNTPVDSAPVSPSQEDARRAAVTLLSYIQHSGTFDTNEYKTIVQLTKKLQIHQHQPGRPSIGGLSRIPEGDVELPPMILRMEPM